MRMISFAAAGLGAVVAVTGFDASAASAAALPGVVVDYALTEVVVQVKPTTIRPYKDLYYSNLRWTKLTGSVGYATGIRHINTCEPTCADANYVTDKVALKFSAVRTTSTKKRVFSRVQVTVVETHALPTSGF